MGKKGYNWKARQVAKTIVDNSETKNITLDLNTEGHYDASNELVLPSKKRKTKIKDEKIKIVRILSKKHRKKLEKIVENKKKKANRSNILEELQKVQLSQEERDKLISLASVQTKGLKRIFKEGKSVSFENRRKVEIAEDVDGIYEVENVVNDCEIVEKPTDLNTVGFESSTDGELSDSEHEDETPSKKVKLETETIEEQCETLDIVETHDDICDKQSTVEQSKREANIEPRKTNGVLFKPKVEKKPALYVDVIRDPQIQTARLKLPILAEEQQIMEVINSNSIIIVSGETGSGKTTQIPQFLYEGGYALKKQIAVTEPRRIAAISMSQRVAEEMNLSGREVSFLVRFQGNVTDDTKIKFMTDGVLLKEVQSDFLLSNYSVVILDEAHERSLYTDILVGLLSRIVKLREKKNDPLKLIVMSATLRLEDFTTNRRLFKVPPPVIKVDTRQFPVTIHFNRRTEEDYLKEAFRKTVKIHSTLPDGVYCCFDRVALKKTVEVENDALKDLGDNRKKGKRSKKVVLPEINLNDYSLPGDAEHNSDYEGSDSELEDPIGTESVVHGQPLWVLPLYSLLSVQKQNRIFQQVPSGCRLCVVSTNVAETSLTIPGIKYVVDSGKTKTKLYDKVTGVSSYAICWTSKASADQRAGRAGRMGPGHCYRLYSSAVFNDTFVDFGEPEIRRAPADDLYLRMRNMNIEKIINFPFPTAPDLLQLKTAETRLKILGVLDQNGKVTGLGRAVSKFPVLPRFGKMLALSHQHEILPYTICLVAALSIPEVLMEVSISAKTDSSDKWAATRLRWAGSGNSYLLGDNMVLLKAVGAAEFAHSEGKLEQFCAENGIRSKAVSEIRKLRLQLSNEISVNVADTDVVVDPKMAPPNDLQAKLLRQILLAGLGDQVAKKMSVDEVPAGENKAKFKYAYHANNMEDLVFLHRGSVLKRSLPEFVIYQELYETNKIYMRGVTAIEPEWLPIYVPTLCNLGAPLADPPPCFTGGKVMCTIVGTFGSQAWPLPPIKMEYPKTEDAYKWFAKFLLEGEVVEKLKRFSSSLLSQPSIMTKTWAKLQARTQSLLKALLSRDVRDAEALMDAWTQDPKCKLWLLELMIS
ncbi:hypothetical protein HHI36_021087 [Cryptolaemus montrouzieri]|uniref:RNA helicase n=1 Tax=Cryptolaemus montrouzieri TaxID=559131 RepID=A0ABD2MVV9_9CUCU